MFITPRFGVTDFEFVPCGYEILLAQVTYGWQPLRPIANVNGSARSPISTLKEK